MSPREIVILYNEPVAGSGADDWDVLDQVMAVETALQELAIPVSRLAVTSRYMEEVEALAASGVKQVFNLVEAIANKGEFNYFVPALLNRYGITYSGNPLEALFITTSKRLTHRILRQYGVRVPVSLKPSEWEKLEPGRKYILKPVWEEGSAGITADSVFTFTGTAPLKSSPGDDNAWQIEEFIEGREFNISILDGENGPEVLPFAEILFRNFEPGRPRIVDYHAKWTPGSFEYENTLRDFPDLSDQPGLATALRETALAAWDSLQLKGYARVDMRVDEQGNVVVLEANANPCISPDSGFTAAALKAGYSFTTVIRRILSVM